MPDRSARVDVAALRTTEGRPATPSPYQQWILDAAASGEVDELYAAGGFGSGKTQVLAWAALRAILRCYAAWDGKRATRARLALISSDGAQLRTVTLPAVAAALGHAVGHDGPLWAASTRLRHPLVRGWSREERTFDGAWWTLTLATGHSGAESIEGGSYCVILGDESPLWLPVALSRARARLRQTGYPRMLLHAATPQPGRSLADIMSRYQDCDPCRVYSEVDADGGAYRRCIVRMPTSANAAHLPSGYLAQLASGVSPQMARAYLHGELVRWGTRVYETYDPAANGTDWPAAGRPDLRLVAAWDPGYHRPHVGLWQEMESGSGRWICIDEVSVSDVSTAQLAQYIAALPALQGLSTLTICADPAGSAAVAAVGTSEAVLMREALAALGIRATVQRPQWAEDRVITARVEQVRAALCSYSGTRRLYVARHLQQRRYPDGSDGRPVIGVHRALLEQPLRAGSDEPDRTPRWDPWSHPADSTGYFVTSIMPTARVDHAAYLSATASAAAPTGRVALPVMGGRRR